MPSASSYKDIVASVVRQTESSIVPLAVGTAGRRFEDFVSDVVDAALTRTTRAPL